MNRNRNCSRQASFRPTVTNRKAQRAPRSARGREDGQGATAKLACPCYRRVQPEGAAWSQPSASATGAHWLVTWRLDQVRHPPTSHVVVVIWRLGRAAARSPSFRVNDVGPGVAALCEQRPDIMVNLGCSKCPLNGTAEIAQMSIKRANEKGESTHGDWTWGEDAQRRQQPPHPPGPGTRACRRPTV